MSYQAANIVAMRLLRTVLTVGCVLALIALWMLSFYGRRHGWQTEGLGMALGAVTAFSMLLSRPALRPAKAPDPPRPVRALFGRVLIVLCWLTWAAMAGYLAYYLAGQLDSATFQPVLADGAAAGWLLRLGLRAGRALVGFPPERRRARWRSVVSSALQLVFAVLIAGYANPLSRFASAIGLWVPEQASRLVHGWTGTYWVALPVAVIVGLVWAALLLSAVLGLRRLAQRVMGPDDPVSQWLDDQFSDDSDSPAWDPTWDMPPAPPPGPMY
jgi:hypothetical protein